MKKTLIFVFCTSLFCESLRFSPPHYAKPDKETIMQFSNSTEETSSKQESTPQDPPEQEEQNLPLLEDFTSESIEELQNIPQSQAQDTPQDEAQKELQENMQEQEIQENLQPSSQEAIAEALQKVDKDKLKIALMMPKKIIGRYSSATIDTILTYLSARGHPFYFEVFDSIDEESNSIHQAYEEILDKDFDFIIGIFTIKGANSVATLELEIPFYIPTTNIKDIISTQQFSPFLIFGGIDYDEQIRLLLRVGGEELPIIAYNDDSLVGERLGEILKDYFPQTLDQVIDQKSAATFSRNAKTQEKLIKNTNVFLNTPIVKSGLLLSQIGYFKTKPSKILSTQLNYSPSLLILTQQRDRNELYIANSISKTNLKLAEYATLLNSDLEYDWVNYSTALGMEFFYRFIFPDEEAFFEEQILNQQMQYFTKIYKINPKGFYSITLDSFPPITLPERIKPIPQETQETQETNIQEAQNPSNPPQNIQQETQSIQEEAHEPPLLTSPLPLQDQSSSTPQMPLENP